MDSAVDLKVIPFLYRVNKHMRKIYMGRAKSLLSSISAVQDVSCSSIEKEGPFFKR